ncbi:terminase [Aureimonas endophytica]|uniref:Terminase n=1 Tax=Aureimonas endophytica TaxID=2027858 RepID=A0A916ZK79_9HYPH|nr:terminase gpA endonuclease subunit [Aureimonas endophytica]GGE00341.1 terminase [Aureimonas endophytica]
MSLLDDPGFTRDCIELTRTGAGAFLAALGKGAQALVPNEPMDIVEWIESHVVIPPEVSERAGPAEVTKLQAGILRAGQDHRTRQRTFKKPVRIGSSLMTAFEILYYAFHEGQPCIYYERSDGAAQDFHDKVLMPLILASPKLAPLLRPRTKAGVQDAWSDIILRNGAPIQMRSASNNSSFRAIKGSKVFADEVSSKEWRDLSKHSEGSKLGLARNRGQQFANFLLGVGSTPTNAGECVVSIELARSDRRRFHVPCPHCQVMIPLLPDIRRSESRSMKTGGGLRWTETDDRVDDAWYECQECDRHIEEVQKLDLLDKGEWVATSTTGEEGHAGFEIWGIYSSDPRSGFLDIARDHRKAQHDAGEMPRFVNTVLAQEFSRSPVAEVDPASLDARKVAYKLADGTPAEGPSWAIGAWAGIDAQQGSLDDQTRPPRLEMTIHVTGPNRRRAVVKHHVIAFREVVDRFTGEIEEVPVEPFTAACADIVWEILERGILLEDGRRLPIKRCAVDNGWRTDDAQKFCMLPKSKALGIVPVRGASSERAGNRAPLVPANLMVARSPKSGRQYLWVGTQTAKDIIRRILSIPVPGPESVEFSADLPEDYFRGLLQERLVEIRPGVRMWRPIDPKITAEPLDCLAYSLAMERMDVRKNPRLRKAIDEIAPEAVEAALVAQAEAAAAPVDPPPEPPADASPGKSGEAEGQAGDQTSGGVRFRIVQRVVPRPVPPVETEPAKAQKVRRRPKQTGGIGW